jgi:protein-S-isoprenylcysteine O-methyltransferase Ste14
MLAKALVQTAVLAVLFGAMLFAPAGRLDWWQAWAFIVLFVASSVAMATALAMTDPALLKERTSVSGGRGLKPWDRVFFALLPIGVVAWFVGMGWEARLNPPAWGWVGHLLGGAMQMACMWIAWRTFRENSFAAPAVQVQSDRAQEVIETGPYALVRHPLYAGALLWMIGTPLLLGSRWGLVGSALMILLVAVRAVGEEKVLVDGLAGYEAYRRKVRFRFVPGVW